MTLEEQEAKFEKLVSEMKYGTELERALIRIVRALFAELKKKPAA